MRDPNFLLLLLGSFCVFAVIALFSHQFVGRLTRTARLKRPHPILISVLRIWFGLLALGSLGLLVQQLLHLKHHNTNKRYSQNAHNHQLHAPHLLLIAVHREGHPLPRFHLLQRSLDRPVLVSGRASSIAVQWFQRVDTHWERVGQRTLSPDEARTARLHQSPGLQAPASFR